MYKTVNMVMLPTDEKASISINRNGKMFINSFSDTVNYNLYITSDDEIKENTNTFKEGLNGDWFYNTKYKTIANNGDITPFDFKIIATTDSSLMITKSVPHSSPNNVSGKRKEKIVEKLPQIPQQFIEYFVSEYNKGNIITEVMVEFDEVLGRYSKDINDTYFVPKINQDNTINIKPVKDSWTREEVEKLINNFAYYHHINWLNNKTQKWIEENL